MGYLGVNIHENVVLTNETKFDDNGYFQIGLFTKVDTGNMFGAFDGETSLEADTNNVKMFVPNVTDWEQKPKSSTQIGQELINFKNILVDLLSVQMPMEKAQSLLNTSVMFAGLGITQQNQNTLATRLLEGEFVKSVFNNTANAFIATIKPFVGQNPFRLKLRRTSKVKHFATIPPKSKFPEVWIESMQVPVEASQIKWSDWEIKNGYNSGQKVETDQPEPEATKKVEDMFANPASAPAPEAVPATIDTPPAEAEGFPQPEPAVNPFNQ